MMQDVHKPDYDRQVEGYCTYCDSPNGLQEYRYEGAITRLCQDCGYYDEDVPQKHEEYSHD